MEIITHPEFMERIQRASAAINFAEVENLISILEKAYLQRNTIYVFGNGGSGATASHFCEDLGKGTLNGVELPQRFKVLSLTDNTPYILAWANDNGYESIFEQQLRNFAEPQDVAIGISGSGNSSNVLRAFEFGNSIDMVTVGVTGFDGGKLRQIAQHCVHVPIDDMGIAESIHLMIFHYVVYKLRDRINQFDGKLGEIVKKAEIIAK